VYIIFIANCFMHTNSGLQHELPILTNIPSAKRQVQTQMT